MKWYMAQMDLARQPETVQTICNFIDLLADSGYNSLLLYLEDRLSTEVYSSDPDESYTAEEMRTVVQYAAGHFIEIIPCISVLGHAERFLRHASLTELAEIRKGGKGRFGGTRKSAFCPSVPAVKEFLYRYLKEVAGIFPSRYFHIGLDEVWDIGFCPLCREKKEDELFLEHLLSVREMMVFFGKQCIIWADMFEIYPDILEQLPRDVILADWHYDRDIHSYRGHFLNQCQEDFIARCRTMGFEIISALSDFTRSNITTGIKYAMKHDVQGVLITTWARPNAFFLRQQAMFIYAGLFLHGNGDDSAFIFMCEKLFGKTTLEFQEGLRLAMQIPENRFGENFNLTDGYLFCRPFSGLPYAQWESYALALRLLESYSPERGRDIYEDILIGMRGHVASQRLKASCHSILEYGMTNLSRAELEDEITHVCELMDAVKHLWTRQRGRFAIASVVAYQNSLRENLNALIPIFEENRYLLIRFFQPDFYSAARTYIEWENHEQCSGIYKLLDVHDCFYEMFFPIKGKMPREIQIASSGYGGQGIAYVELRDGDRHLFPREVNVLSGLVTEPEHILCNDARWAYFGLQSVRKSFEDKTFADMLHKVSIIF